MAEAGQMIGPYRMLSVIGRGAMGEVWRARDERLDRLVALKLLPRDQKSSAERRARMIREAKAAASIPHRNIVTLYDIVTEGGEDVLVMELIEGRTLAERVAEEGPLSAPDALDVLAGLTAALVAAHAEGVLHRDIKTANVMQGRDGEVKVLDFGLAKLRVGDDVELAAGSPAPPVDRPDDGEPDAEDDDEPVDAAGATAQMALDQTLASVDDRRLSETMPAESQLSADDRLLVTRAGQILGTPMYMAPEQFAGEVPTERSEVFSVGVVAHEILSGAPPFAADTYEDLQTKVFTVDPPALPATVPRDLSAVISKALAKEPEDRFASMEELRERIDAMREVGRAPARWVWALAAVTPLAIIAVAVALMMVRRGPQAPDPEPERPGDHYVTQALGEYNLFYNQKAAASLRAAVREAPDNPMAYAYALLFPTESGPEQGALVSNAERVRREVEVTDREKALLDAGIALATRGPAQARASLQATTANDPDGELAFWAAELAYRARDYEVALTELRAALETSDKAFHGRIYDHFSAVLSYMGEHQEAVEIGRRYAEAFSGEADAVGVYATTLARVGKLDEALAAATEARRLYEGEDTVAGLAKIHAYRGETRQARKLYRKSAAMASDARRTIRLAALAWLAWIDGDDEVARREVAACLPGGDDANIWQRGPCLWVAGTIWPQKTDVAIAELEKLAAAGTALTPPYGFPANLAKLLRARQIFFAGACHRPPENKRLRDDDRARRAALLAEGRDFFASYHIPFFGDYERCELTGGAPVPGP